MRSLGWDAGLILDTVSSVLSSKNHGSTAAVNELLAELTLQVDRDLLDGVLALLPTLAVRPNLQSYEVLLDAHLCLDNFRAAARELRARGATAGWTDQEIARALEVAARARQASAVFAELFDGVPGGASA